MLQLTVHRAGDDVLLFVVGRYGALYRFGRRDVTSTESRQDRALVALVNKKNIHAFEGNAIGFDIAWKTAQT